MYLQGRRKRCWRNGIDSVRRTRDCDAPPHRDLTGTGELQQVTGLPSYHYPRTLVTCQSSYLPFFTLTLVRRPIIRYQALCYFSSSCDALFLPGWRSTWRAASVGGGSSPLEGRVTSLWTSSYRSSRGHSCLPPMTSSTVRCVALRLKPSILVH